MKSIAVIITSKNRDIDEIATVLRIDFKNNKVDYTTRLLDVSVIDMEEKDPEMIIRNFCEKWTKDRSSFQQMYDELILTLVRRQMKVK